MRIIRGKNEGGKNIIVKDFRPHRKSYIVTGGRNLCLGGERPLKGGGQIGNWYLRKISSH